MMRHKGLNQLLCAAIVNTRFCETLLRNPAQAVAMGYQDQTFSLTPEEHKLVISIQAQRLEDFAAQIYCWIANDGSGPRHGLGPAGPDLAGESGWTADFAPRPRLMSAEHRIDEARLPGRARRVQRVQ